MPIAVIASAGDSAVFLGGAGITDARPDVREFASGWHRRNSIIVVGPQQRMEPSLTRAQVCQLPALTSL